MDKNAILAKISEALEALEKDAPHKTTDITYRNCRNEQFSAEMQTVNGNVVFFSFESEEHRQRQRRISEAASRMHE